MEMKKARITILNMEKAKFTNDKTGEVSYMTKIMYAIPMANTEKLKGQAILRCYCNGEAFDKLEKFIMIPSAAEIEERATVDGAKYYLTQIADVKVR